MIRLEDQPFASYATHPAGYFLVIMMMRLEFNLESIPFNHTIC